jgi:hypothetical protein
VTSRIKKGLILFSLFFCVFVADYTINGKRAASKQRQIDQELAAIAAPTGAALIGFNSSYKTHGGETNRHFRTNLSSASVVSFYRTQLEDHDWAFCEEEKIQGKHRVVFHHQEDTAIVILPMDDSSQPIEFTLSISWGLFHHRC